MNGKNVLITGHRGFIGRNLEHFIRSAYPGARIISPKSPKEHLSFHDPDVLRSQLKELGPDYIFHFASAKGETSSPDPDWHFENAVKPVKTLLETLLSLKSNARIIIPGSAAEYGVIPSADLPVQEDFSCNPVSAYGQAKKQQTELALSYSRMGLTVIVGRIFNIIGKDAPENILSGSFLFKLRKTILESDHRITVGKITVGNLDILRDFVDIEDVCKALAALAKSGRPGEIYNICSEKSVSLRSILNQMITCSGAQIEVFEDPLQMARNPVLDIRGSTIKIRQEIGWAPKHAWTEAISRIFK